jgi:XTP/dITP diphosphohydrolase
MIQIVIASKNQGKIKEIKDFLFGLNIEFFSIDDFPDLPVIVEDGKTFEDNALKKAKIIYEHTKITTLADDSGLEVPYLQNHPGVHSSRYSGDKASDRDNCEKLLKELKGVEMDHRAARFKCILVFHNSLYNDLLFEGKCKGYIIEEMKGENGFGYDPIFVPEGYNKTFAELDLVTKNKISHRGRALTSLRYFLERIIK